MARYLYSELAALVQARLNCIESINVARCAHSERNNSRITGKCLKCEEWRDNHEEKAESLVKEFMPSGSGFDNGTRLDFDASHADKLVFTTAYHHMNEGGFYDGWTEHVVTITPSLSGGFHLRISGRNRNDIKEYISDCFSNALMTELQIVIG